MAILSTPDFIADELRNAICSGKISAGSPLRQDDIAKQYDVSHIPVREALARLSVEGLVENRPRRGAIVASLSADEIEEINEMRVALETSALRRSIPRTVPGDIARASAILDEIDRSPVAHWGRLNTDFHNALCAPAGRPRLRASIEVLNRNAERYLYQEATIINNFKASQSEHRQLLDLVARGSIDSACALVAEHILVDGAILAAHLREAGLY